MRKPEKSKKKRVAKLKRKSKRNKRDIEMKETKSKRRRVLEEERKLQQHKRQQYIDKLLKSKEGNNGF